MKLLILLVIVLGIIAIAQLTKVYELTRSLRRTREEDISPADNRMNAVLWLVWMGAFFLLTIWLYVRYGDYLPEPASAHGVEVDRLMAVNIWMITIVFFLVNFLLFYFAYKFHYRAERRARFFAHDNRLEMIWTLVPGVTMAFIIVYGLITWNHITGPAGEDALQVEVYSKQFDWTVRYPGDNEAFGAADYNLISTSNPLGMLSREGIAAKLEEIDGQIAGKKDGLARNAKLPVWPASYVETIEDQIYRLERHKQRVLDLSEYLDPGSGLSTWEAGADDRIVKGELHLPVNREVEFVFRSQDVIHSAYMPHFRAQMNTVPGVPTRFKMTPTITTAQMRQKLGKDDFDYILLCNKICGSAHFNMQIKVVIEEEAEYEAWLAQQKTFGQPAAPPAPATTDTTSTATAMAKPQ